MNRRSEPTTPESRPPSSAAGFSLIEVMIASVILLVIAVGTVPLFTQAMASNAAGNDSTKVTNFARERMEEFSELPFNPACPQGAPGICPAPPAAEVPSLEIVAGTERVFDEYYRRERVSGGSVIPEGWVDGTLADADAAGDAALWTRVTTVRQYNITALEDGELVAAEALDAGALPGEVHFKEVQVRVESTREAGALGRGKDITLRTIKSQ